MRLRLRLLGGFEARLEDGTPVVTGRRKADALLAYLAVHAGQVHPRDKLAALLWAEAPAEAARQSLRQALVAIRHLLPRGTAPLVTIADGIALEQDAVGTDVADFERLAAEEAEATLTAAADLYRGDLLAGLAPQSPPFEEWLAAERARLHELALEALARVLAGHVRKGRIEAAIRTAVKLLSLDPTQEVVHRGLMRLYASQGRRGTALCQYEECVEILKRELDTEPEDQTRALYRELLHGHVPAVDEVSAGAATPSRREVGGPAERFTRPPSTIADEEAAASGTVPLIGRGTQLAQVRSALDAAWRDRARVVTITGDAGIGKSRLAAELTAEALARGGRVLIGRGYESEQVLAFGPWVGALRGAGVASEPRLRETIGPACAELARLLPELGQSEPGAPPGPATEEGHLRLFHAVVSLIEHMAARTPLVLVLEDLHWADEMTLRLVSFAARRLERAPVLLTLTAREEELADARALRHVLEEIQREVPLVRVALAALSQPETEELVRRLVGTGRPGPDARRLPAEVWAASEGNPFFIVEIMRALAEGNRPEGLSGLSLPARVRELIAGRLERLQPEARQVAEAAALIGRDFEFALLAHTLGLSDDDAADKVEELVRRRVLRAVGDHIDFVHDRIREVAREAMLPLRRRVLHERAARALEALYGSNLGPHYAALAQHYREAENRVRAGEYLRLAAEQALIAFAHREAEAFLEEALALVEDDASFDRAELLGRLATVAWYRGDVDASARRAEEALTLWTRLGHRRNALAMRLHIAGLFISAAWDWARENEALAHLEAASALVDDEPDSVEKGMIYQRTAHLYLHRGEPAKTLTWARQAADLYARLGVAAGTSLGTALTYTGRVNEGVVYNERNWESTARSGNPVAIVILSHELALTAALLRDPARARHWAEQGATMLRGMLFEAMVHRPLVLASVLAGDLARAREGCEVVTRLERQALVGCFLEATVAVALYHLRRGDLEAARAYLDESAAKHEPRGNVQAVAACAFARGLVHLAGGDHPGALRHLGRALEVCRAGGNVLFELWVLPALVEAWLAAGERDTAAEAVERGFWLLAPDQHWRGLPAPLHRVRGMLAHAANNWEVAADSFQRAVAIDREYGLPWDEARTLLAWGSMLADRDLRGDRNRAREMWLSAADIFENVGAVRDAGQARAHRAGAR